MEDLDMAYNNNRCGNQGNHRNNGQHSRNKTDVKCSQKNGQKNKAVADTRSNNRSNTRATQVYHKGNRHVNTSGYNPKNFPPNPFFGQISYDGKFIFTSRRGWVKYNPNYKKSRQQNISFQQHNSSSDNRKVKYQANNHYHNCGNTYHVTKNVTNISNSYNTVEKKKKKKKKDKETNAPSQVYYFEPEPKSSGIGKYIAAAAVGALIALVV